MQKQLLDPLSGVLVSCRADNDGNPERYQEHHDNAKYPEATNKENIQEATSRMQTFINLPTPPAWTQVVELPEETRANLLLQEIAARLDGDITATSMHADDYATHVRGAILTFIKTPMSVLTTQSANTSCNEELRAALQALVYKINFRDPDS